MHRAHLGALLRIRVASTAIDTASRMFDQQLTKTPSNSSLNRNSILMN